MFVSFDSEVSRVQPADLSRLGWMSTSLLVLTPFGIANFKMIPIRLLPLGRAIVPTDQPFRDPLNRKGRVLGAPALVQQALPPRALRASGDEFGHDSGADGPAALTDGEAQALLHGDGVDQCHFHFDVVPGRDHFDAFG